MQEDNENINVPEPAVPENNVFTSEQIQYIRESFGVPNDVNVTCEVSEAYYWDAGERTVAQVTFNDEGGNMVAGATVDVNILEQIKIFIHTHHVCNDF